MFTSSRRTGQAPRERLIVLALLATPFALAACGSHAKLAAAPSTPAPATTAPAATTSAATQTTPGALQPEAAATATGDVPDNQVYVPYADHGVGYTIEYPEGWAQSGGGPEVAFRDKNNIVRVLVERGGAATPLSVRVDMAALRKSIPSLRYRQPVALRISGAPAVKVAYTTLSPPNPVTNKRVALTVDRYYLARAGKRAVIDLGTPVGVDNVDAYRLMIESFRWR